MKMFKVILFAVSSKCISSWRFLTYIVYYILFLFHREMVNAWFAERVHTIPVCKEGTKSQSESCACQQLACSENTNSGTPARKISASEFDRPLRPIFVKDSVGAVSFLSGSEKKEQMPLQSPRTGTSAGDRCSRLLELVKDISSHLDVTALCHKIFLHIHELIAADRYSLFLVCEDSSNEKFLVSRLFDVAEGSTLEEASNNCIRLEWNKGIVGHVAAIGQPLNIKNAYEVNQENLSWTIAETRKSHIISWCNVIILVYVFGAILTYTSQDGKQTVNFQL